MIYKVDHLSNFQSCSGASICALLVFYTSNHFGIQAEQFSSNSIVVLSFNFKSFLINIQLTLTAMLALFLSLLCSSFRPLFDLALLLHIIFCLLQADCF